MRVCVIIATFNRVQLLPSLLALLDRQTRPPAEVILSAPDASHVVHYTPQRYTLSFVFGRSGSSAQRNQALDQVVTKHDIITFFDDDFIPSDDYLEQVVALMHKNPAWLAVTGNVVADGVKGPGLSFEEGVRILRDSASRNTEGFVVSKLVGAYGCNMSFRAEHIRDLRFDERLVLYGWQEDVDFSSQLRRYGDVVRVSSLTGVHLGVKSGRTSGVRFGYSQICNPVYLMLKGTLPPAFALKRLSKNLAANIVKSFWPEPYIDRRGRLRGNLLALLHVLRGKVQPEYILNL